MNQHARKWSSAFPFGEGGDAFPSSLLDPLEGPSMLNCGKLELEGPHPTSSTKGGKRGVLKVPGFD
jgi:hypothetical protein